MISPQSISRMQTISRLRRRTLWIRQSILLIQREWDARGKLLILEKGENVRQDGLHKEP